MTQWRNGIGTTLLAFAVTAYVACGAQAPDAASTPKASSGGGNLPVTAGESIPVPESLNDLPDTGKAIRSSGSTANPSCYFQQVAQQAVRNLGLAGNESNGDKIKATYKYVIALTTYIEYDQPELVEHWRYQDNCGQPPSIYQVMGAGPLLYGIGTCEQYSAALVVLLEQMGFEALYVPGLTYSVQGTLVDHAWVMVKMDGQWYHIDPQLEDNVMRGDCITYQYFLKGDEEFLAHHLWGGHLPQPDDYSLELPACPVSLPWQPAENLPQKPPPDVARLVEAAAREQAAHTGQVCELQPEGALPPLPRDMHP